MMTWHRAKAPQGRSNICMHAEFFAITTLTSYSVLGWLFRVDKRIVASQGKKSADGLINSDRGLGRGRRQF
jgi:hypothetical protein